MNRGERESVQTHERQAYTHTRLVWLFDLRLGGAKRSRAARITG